MRTVSFAINLSLDGYCDHTFANPSEQLMEYFADMMEGIDLVFYGRVTYELMFPYWEDVARHESGSPAENRFAKRLSVIDNVVMSRTLTTARDNTTIVSGNAADELRKLKQTEGGKISVSSVSLLPELINAGLIDEFELVIHPALVGNGRQLLPSGSLHEQLNLKLVSTQTFDNGCVAQHYVNLR
ncbi:dihydrofolate reductase family protein [Mucilaginibacter pedocola]|uniref:Deaminase n=1 Tax=Mucilaginibacter pedocola TaxID=1792845 RepID=A0A1S9PF13_9SPHI|nr:dihydrofolate reductase family protein [Mucilaginibacter pedocola]OOQ59553.1 deaminase [Mucilaginibacter pedocola]